MSDLQIRGHVPYARVPVWLLRLSKSLQLQSTDLAVYAALMSFADNYTQVAWPGIEAVADRAAASPDTVRRSLKRLQYAKVVQVTQRPGKSSWYQLAYTPEAAGLDPMQSAHTPPQHPSQDARGGDAEASGDPSQTATRTTPTYTQDQPQGGGGHLAEADRWAQRWAQLRGIPYTKAVRRQWVRQVHEYLQAGGTVTDELLQRAKAKGIEQPAGWPYAAVGDSSTPLGWGGTARPDPADCDHPPPYGYLDGIDLCRVCGTEITNKETA